jgi:DNA-directed RNA polymerase specialized sigma24 family protein
MRENALSKKNLKFFVTSCWVALCKVMNMQQMDTRDDAELLTEFAADGCHAAFAALVNHHGPMAHGIAMRVLSSHHDAQDVTQAVFILLARDAKKLASSPSVAGWIHAVTRRLALNVHDSRARGKLRELLGQRDVEIASVTVLSSFLTNELEASSAFSPELASTILNDATGGASVSAHVLALTAKGAISTTFHFPQSLSL